MSVFIVMHGVVRGAPKFENRYRNICNSMHIVTLGPGSVARNCPTVHGTYVRTTSTPFRLSIDAVSRSSTTAPRDAQAAGAVIPMPKAPMESRGAIGGHTHQGLRKWAGPAGSLSFPWSYPLYWLGFIASLTSITSSPQTLNVLP